MRLDRSVVARVAALATVIAGSVLGIANWGGIAALSPDMDAPGVLEAILLVKPVLAAVRVGVMGLALYIVASIVGLVIEGRWLVKAGISGAEADSARTESLVVGSQEEVEDWLATTESSIAELWDAIDTIEERVYVEGEE
jgi:hypothetical protein